ncbi:hypothetical protein F8388_007964 [Cannabis sativa]|uniref:Glycosyltransferase n=1 Tax=Cannabis sativa TaxID=3483 RepID=A0A7J6FTV0_CANSA|nr:hypothetical protein F8388_007964 [Cannabis sativa]
MRSESHEHQLHVIFFPYMAQGHLIPNIHMAKLFASKGTKVTILTTSHFTPFLAKSIENNTSQINILNIKFPATEVGLPEEVDSSPAARTPEMFEKFVSSDSEHFLIPDLPDQIELTASKLPYFMKHHDESTELGKLYIAIREVERRNYGIIVNSFYELEPAYADLYKKVSGIKTWQIGPLFLSDYNMSNSNNQLECMKWLDTKKPSSVIYVSFGSVANFNDEQLMEIATGLEASGQQFIWVVKKEKVEGVEEEWLPEGFEERMKERGLIVRGWAPQVPILEHEAVGGFVTHCGWNSILESVCAGVPMVTWPVAAEQFFNEKLVSQVLNIGVEVGARKWVRMVGDFVKRERIRNAVSRIMEGEEAEEMRRRVKSLAEMGRSAIKEAGSSMLDFNALFHDLRSARIARDSTHRQENVH